MNNCLICQYFAQLSIPVSTDYNDLGSTTIAAALVENLDNIELIQIPNDLTHNEGLNGALFGLESCSDENMQSVNMENLPIAVENDQIPIDSQLNCSEYTDGLELVNYKVELLDEFNVTDQIEFQDEPLTTDNQNSFNIDGIYNIDDPSNKTNDVVLSYLYPEDVSIDDLPMEVMETLETSISSQDCPKQTEDHTCSDYEKLCRTLDETQLQLYFNWLDSVIETINLALDFNDDGFPDPIKFSVPHVILHKISISPVRIQL